MCVYTCTCACVCEQVEKLITYNEYFIPMQNRNIYMYRAKREVGRSDLRAIITKYIHVACDIFYADVYMNTHTLRKGRQSNTRPETTFSKHSGGTHLTHSRRDTLPTELPRQLSWLSSNHLHKPRQSKASQPDKQVNSNLVLRRRPG